MEVLGPVHRDRPKATWANNDIKGSDSEEKVQGNQTREQSNSTETEREEKKKNLIRNNICQKFLSID